MCFLSVVGAEAIEDIQIQEELEDIQKPLKKIHPDGEMVMLSLLYRVS